MEHQSPSHEQEPSPDSPRIYVASLSDYNDGRLHGCWIDATDDPADIRAGIAAMLGASADPGAEEYAIHDYSGFHGFTVGEYEDIETVHRIACGIAEHGEAFSAFVDLVGTASADADTFIDVYYGTYPTFRTFADGFIESMGWNDEIDRFGEKTGLAPFLTFDYDNFEATLRSEWSVVDGHTGVHIFAP